MTDGLLAELAEAAGLAPRWRDVHGQTNDVSPDTLRAVLRAIGVAAGSDAEVRDSLAHLRRPDKALPPLITADSGQPFRLPGRYRLTIEGGDPIEGQDEVRVTEPGYHRLETDRQQVTLAVAPPRCHGVPGGRAWGISVQLYSLRRQGDGGLGDFGALRDFVGAAALRGADAIAVSPVHAQFTADPDRFSPYAPSSRIMLNVLHADTDVAAPELEALDLVDWPAAARARIATLRRAFEGGEFAAEAAEFRRKAGPTLEAHARFEALHAHFYGGDPSLWHWRSWPEAFRDPGSPAVAEFAKANAREVGFHAWLQFMADRGLAEVQHACRERGMRIGLISDLAVGTDSGGSHAWSRQGEMLIGLTVGAPPDLLGPMGQDWGLVAFSPTGMRAHGYAAFIEMLRSALRHAGGVRIDHAMGLQRLWVLPEGQPAHQGAYLHFPVDDLFRLVRLESTRHQAVILGEDLGTLPDGFHGRLIGAGMLGMRVLWFERDGDRFRPPHEWSREATAMTSTHDLPTTAGWWCGRDLEWREKLELSGGPEAARRERESRERDRVLLWSTLQASGAATGEPPPADQPASFVAAAADHVARSACEMVLLPVEDLLGRVEQPNLPGTLQEHPNWRRRLPGPAGALLDPPEVGERLQKVVAARAG